MRTNHATMTQQEEHPEPPCWDEGATREQAMPEEAESKLIPPPELITLLQYMKVNYDTFQPSESRYFTRLRELLAFHQVVDPHAPLDRTNFGDAVKVFQQRTGLSVDGIPGENTLWALQYEWAKARKLPIVRVEADVAPGTEGYSFFEVRQDVVESYNQLRAAINGLGGLVTSSGSLRSLNAPVTPGRSPTSLHYTGAALDLHIYCGLQHKDRDAYLLTLNGRQWQFWARAAGGTEQTIQATFWSSGQLRTEPVTAPLINFTELARTHGFQTIGCRECFPSMYECAEWWHLQSEAALVPFISQFGTELLSVQSYAEDAVQGQAKIWANRKLIFRRSWF